MKNFVFRSSLVLLSSVLGSVACGGEDGKAGQPGTDGSDGMNSLTVSVEEPPGENCAE
jgi:hypothetical protein